MSLARIYTTKTVRKDWTCEKCGAPIRKGQDGRISFAVGFRGRERTRCTKAECYPTRAERESSAVATVYDVIDSIDFASLDSLEALEEARDSVVEALNEVAEEYQDNEMFEINEGLQERVEMLESAASDLEGWEPESGEPDEDDEETWNDNESFEVAHEAWLDEARGTLESAINDLETP